MGKFIFVGSVVKNVTTGRIGTVIGLDSESGSTIIKNDKRVWTDNAQNLKSICYDEEEYNAWKNN